MNEPAIDKKGRITHPCSVCGNALAPYGYGVDLLKGRLGTWYCHEHRPQPAASTEQNSSKLAYDLSNAKQRTLI
jgi:hypothetical protein